MKLKIKKGDFVQVMTGGDKGKKGRVIEVLPASQKVLVEGINLVHRHTKPKKVDRQGGIIQIEKPVAIGNVRYFCMKCEKPVRLGVRVLDDGTKTKYCRKCGEPTGAK